MTEISHSDSTSVSPDLWAGLEGKALSAFGKSINRRASGLVAVIGRATRYAAIDENKREIVLDLRALFLATLSVGLSDTPSLKFGNTATWFATWLSKRIGRARLVSLVDGNMSGTDALLSAFRLGFDVTASASVHHALEVARGYARRTVKRSAADLRHFFVAALTSSSAAAVFARVSWTPTHADLADLQRELHDRIAANPEPREDMAAWRQILLTDEGQSRSVRTEFVPRFTNDRPAAYNPLGGDHLDTDPDVVALARLICLKEATTPLSIGIFGGWGAGKSTFMNRLEAEITRITEHVAAQASAPRDAGETAKAEFISHVVQIRFNAWQFADTNLWASLTAEFFDQLRAGGFSRQDSAVHAKLVTEVNDHVQQLTKAAAETEEALNTEDDLVIAAREDRDNAMRVLTTDQPAGLSHTFLKTISDIYEKHKADLVELGHHFNQNDIVSGVDDFIDVAKSAISIAGRGKLVWHSIWTKPRRMILLVLAILLTAISIWILRSFDPAKIISVNSAGILSVLAALAAAGAALRPGIRVVASIVRTTTDFAKRLDSVAADSLKIFQQKKAALEEKEAALKAAEAEAAARREAAAKASKALVRYVSSSDGNNSPRLLRYVLEDAPDTKAIDREIGLISRARRLFQAVDTIVAEKKPGNAHEDIPDRIVLYIDDLDRCTHRQVYEALQAIHLLLDFELFAVVVAVDVAWIQAALAAQTEMGMPVAPTASDETAGLERQNGAVDLERRKRAIAYLEKIFQLPFWLRPLNTDDEKGGSYGALVRGLLESDTVARADGQAAGGGNRPSTGNTPPPDTGDTQKQPDESGRRTGAETRREWEDELDVALEAITLSQDEVDFLSSSAIGALAPRTPRGAKRLVNIYRLVRTRMNDPARSLISTADAEANRSIVALLVAVETGQPVEAADPLYEGLKMSAPETDLIRDVSESEVPPSDSGRLALLAAFRACPALREAVVKVEEARERPLTVGDCLPVARLVRRYSFNRYQ